MNSLLRGQSYCGFKAPKLVPHIQSLDSTALGVVRMRSLAKGCGTLRLVGLHRRAAFNAKAIQTDIDATERLSDPAQLLAEARAVALDTWPSPNTVVSSPPSTSTGAPPINKSTIIFPAAARLALGVDEPQAWIGNCHPLRYCSLIMRPKSNPCVGFIDPIHRRGAPSGRQVRLDPAPPRRWRLYGRMPQPKVAQCSGL